MILPNGFNGFDHFKVTLLEFKAPVNGAIYKHQQNKIVRHQGLVYLVARLYFRCLKALQGSFGAACNSANLELQLVKRVWLQSAMLKLTT